MSPSNLHRVRNFLKRRPRADATKLAPRLLWYRPGLERLEDRITPNAFQAVANDLQSILDPLQSGVSAAQSLAGTLSDLPFVGSQISSAVTSGTATVQSFETPLTNTVNELAMGNPTNQQIEDAFASFLGPGSRLNILQPLFYNQVDQVSQSNPASGTGTVTLTNNMTTVTFSMPQTFADGDSIQLDSDGQGLAPPGPWVQIAAGGTGTTFTLTAPYAGNGGTGAWSRASLSPPVSGTGTATITTTNNDSTVSFSTSQTFATGDNFRIDDDGTWYQIASGGTGTSFHLTTAYTGTTTSGAWSTVAASPVYVAIPSNTPDDLDIEMRLAETLTTTTDTGNFSTGLPSLPFKVTASGGIDLSAGFAFELGIKSDGTTASLDDSVKLSDAFPAGSGNPATNVTALVNGVSLPDPNHQLAVFVSATLPHGFSAIAYVGFLRGHITDIGTPSNPDPTTHTELAAEFAVDSLTTSPTAVLIGNADANLGLDLSFGTGTDANGNSVAFPSVSADFHLAWNIDSNDTNNASRTPTVSFDNVSLDLGTFLSNLVGPILSDLQSFLQPLQPVFNVLDTPIPGLSDLTQDLGLGPVTLMTIAGLIASNTGYGPLYQVINAVDDIATALQGVTVGPNGVMFQLGNFDLDSSADNLFGAAEDPTDSGFLGDLNPEDVSLAPLDSQLQAVLGGSLAGAATKALENLTAALNNGYELAFPVLTDPGQTIFAMLLGQDSDLVTFTANLSATASSSGVPSLSYLGEGLNLFGTVTANANIKVAYDTYGIRELIQDFVNGTATPAKIATDILDGFYIADSSSFNISGQIGVEAGGGIGIASAYVTGGITTGDDGSVPISVTMADGKSAMDGGRYRVTVLLADPEAAFNLSGELDASLGITLQIGADVPLVGFVGYQKNFDIASVVLVNFNQPSQQLAGFLDPTSDPGQLTLYVGPEAGMCVVNGSTPTGPEIFSLADAGPSTGGGETIIVTAYGVSQSVNGVTSIVGYGGINPFGNNDLTVTAGSADAPMTIPVTLGGGLGHDDLTYDGTNTATLMGGLLDSTLIGGMGTNTLTGGAGNATLIAGPAPSTNQLTAGPNANAHYFLFAGTGSNVMIGGPGFNFYQWMEGDGPLTITGINPQNIPFNNQLMVQEGSTGGESGSTPWTVNGGETWNVKPVAPAGTLQIQGTSASGAPFPNIQGIGLSNVAIDAPVQENFATTSLAIPTNTLVNGISASASATQLQLANALPALPQLSGAFPIDIDGEEMLATSYDTLTNTLTVQRGYDNTPIAMHNANAVVQIGISASATQVQVADAAALPTSAPYPIEIEGEQMLVTSVAGNTLSVQRGYDGTNPSVHIANAPVGTWTADPGGNSYVIGDLSNSGDPAISINLHDSMVPPQDTDTNPDTITLDGTHSGNDEYVQISNQSTSVPTPNGNSGYPGGDSASVEQVTLSLLGTIQDTGLQAQSFPGSFVRGGVTYIPLPSTQYTVTAAIPNGPDPATGGPGDSLTVNTYQGDATVNVFTTAGGGSTYINTGAGGVAGGANAITVGDANWPVGLDAIQGPLYIDAGNGLDNSLTFTEADATVGDTLTLTDDALIRYVTDSSVPLYTVGTVNAGGDLSQQEMLVGSDTRYEFVISYKADAGGAFEDGIELDTTKGMDTVYVASTPDYPDTNVTVNTGLATPETGDSQDEDEVVVGYDEGTATASYDPESTSTLAGIADPLTVAGGGSASGTPLTGLVIADAGASGPETYTLTARELDRGTARILFNQEPDEKTQLLNLTLLAGGHGNKISVESTNAFTAPAAGTTLGGTTVDAGPGNNTIVVTDPVAPTVPLVGTLNAIAGPLLVDGGGPGADLLELLDTANGLSQSYALGVTTNAAGQVTGGSFFRALSVVVDNPPIVLINPAVNIDYAGISTLKFAASDLADAAGNAVNTIGITGTVAGTQTNVDTEGDNDNVTVTGLGAVQGKLNLNSAVVGSNTVTVDDSAAAPPGTYTVTASTIQGQGSAPITYTNFSQVTLLPAAKLPSDTLNVPSDTVNVQGTAAGTSYTIGSNHDTDETYTVGDTNDTLDQILGPLQFVSLAGSSVTLNDQGESQPEEYDVYQDHVVRSGVTIGIGDAGLTLNGGSGGNTVKVYTAGNADINTGAGNDTVTVYPAGVAESINPVTIDGEAGTNSLTVNDGSDAGNNVPYVVSGTQIGIDLALQPITYANFASVNLDTGSGSGDTVLTSGTGAAPMSITGGGADTTLTGPDQDNQWQLTGANAGTLDATVAFSNIQNLQGGSVSDDFMFETGGTVSGSIDGGAGYETLDCSQYGAPVTVAVTAVGTLHGVQGTATPITNNGTFNNIDNILGSAGSTLDGSNFTGDFTTNLTVAGFGTMHMHVHGNFSGIFQATDTTPIEDFVIDGSLQAAGIITAGGLDSMEVGGDLAGKAVFTGALGSLLVSGDLSGIVSAQSIASQSVGGQTTPGSVTTTSTPTVPFNIAPGDVVGLIQALDQGQLISGVPITINLAAGSAYVLTMADNYWYGPNGLPAIDSTVTINGNGAVIERAAGAAPFRIFYISGGFDEPTRLPAGQLTLNNLTVEGGLAQGGNGGAAAAPGGGGAGLGGAIFNEGTLALDGVTLTQNIAQGGNGGTVVVDPGSTPGGGGGGGLGGAGGGEGDSTPGGGGGGGFATAGSPPSAVGGNGGDGDVVNGHEGGQGELGGAASLSGSNGKFGGGGGGGLYENTSNPIGTSRGGNGGVGGGGGGAYSFVGASGNGGFGGGGGGNAGVAAGLGGFGGGGGTSSNEYGGAGGFGGGDGGGNPSDPSADSSLAGGGAGMGGAIFNMSGLVTITNSTLAVNTAQGGTDGGSGTGQAGGQGGAGYGGALFNLNGTVALVNDTLAGNHVVAGYANFADADDLYNLSLKNVGVGTATTASVTLTNDILAGTSPAGTGGQHDIVNSGAPTLAWITAPAPNLIEQVVAGTLTVTGGGSVIGGDPMLGPLQNNGGPTPTMEVLAGSPLLAPINYGTTNGAPPADQRGVLRGSTINDAPGVILGAYQATVATQLAVNGFPDGLNNRLANAGTSYAFMVTAEDQFGKTVYVYTGTVSFQATCPATLPSPTALIAGTGSFSATLDPASAGVEALSVSDGNIDGVEVPIVVTGTVPEAIAVSSGSGQSTTVGTAFSQPLVALVTDPQNDAPLGGVTVTFTVVPDNNAGGNFGGATSIMEPTNASGLAMAPTLTANDVAGGFTVSATVGSASPAAFDLTNEPGAPALITKIAGDNQTTAIGAVYQTPLEVEVTDGYGNPVGDVPVVFTAPTPGGGGVNEGGDGASGLFGAGATATVDTNAAGMATAPALTANDDGGTFYVSAALQAPVAPTLTSIDPSSATVGSPDTTITATGTNFGASSTVDLNGTPLATTFVSATQLTAVIPAADLTAVGSDPITVVTPGLFGGTSTPQTFTINAAGVTVQFSASSETVNATAGTFSIPVSLSAPATPTVSTFVPTSQNLDQPAGLAFDAADNLFFVANVNGTVSKVTSAGVVSTLTSAVDEPAGLAFYAGDLYVADYSGNVVWKVTTSGTASVYASGFSGPWGLAFDAAGDLYVSNSKGTTVSEVQPGGGTPTTFDSGLSSPQGLAFDAAGNLYVADSGDDVVNKIAFSSTGVFASSTTLPFTFNFPEFLAVDGAGNLYVSNGGNSQFTDAGENTVSMVTFNGSFSTFASGFDNPSGLALDAGGNLYVANFFGNTVSKVTTAVSVPFALGGTATAGADYSGVTGSPLLIPDGQTTANITGTLFADPGPNKTLTLTLGMPAGAALGSPSVNTLTVVEPGTTVQFGAASETVSETAGTFSIPVTVSAAVTPSVTTFGSGNNATESLAFDAAGNLYFPSFNGTVKEVTSAGVSRTFASGFDEPLAVAFDAAGDLYVANFENNTVSVVPPGGGTPTTFATGFDEPDGLAFDAGKLYVANYGNGTVSVVPSGGGAASTYATGFDHPVGVAFDAAGNLYVSNNIADGTVTKLTPPAGAGAPVSSIFASGLSFPGGLALDAAGNLYVADYGSNKVIVVTPAGSAPFASGFLEPYALAFDAAGNLYVANIGTYSVLKVTGFVSVPFTLGGTATAGTDYSGITADTLVIPPGQTTATITGTLFSDPGPNKTLTITLGTPSGANLGSPSVNTLTIDEPPAASTVAPVYFTETNSVAGIPATLKVISGNGQSSPLNVPYQNPLVVELVDANGNPIATGTYQIHFAGPSAGPTVRFAPATVTTLANGEASNIPTPIGAPGTITVTASLANPPAGVTVNPVTFTLTSTNVPGKITGSGTFQATVNTDFGKSPQVTVTDGSGKPVAGLTVTWTAAPGPSGPNGAPSASFPAFSSGPVTSTTNSSGVATAPTVLASKMAGTWTLYAALSANIPGNPVAFSMTNTPGAFNQLVIVGGSGQSATAGTTFASPLIVEAEDAYGNGVTTSVPVKFVAPASTEGVATATANAPPVTTITVNTGAFTVNGQSANGIAEVTFSAGKVASPAAYTVTASSGSVYAQPGFSLTNIPGPFAKLAYIGGAPQSTTVGTAFAAPLVVEAEDQYGNGIVGNLPTVTFTAPSAGASATFSAPVAVSGKPGQIEVTATANKVASPTTLDAQPTLYTVSASATLPSGKTTSVTPQGFLLVNTAGAPFSVATESGTPQTVTAGKAFANLVAKVTDEFGNVVSGASVTFTVNKLNGNYLATFVNNAKTATATTNASGLATAPTLSSLVVTSGTFTVTPAVTGATTASSFSLTVEINDPAVSPPQSATVGRTYPKALDAVVTGPDHKPVAGVRVTFTAPASGPSVTFDGKRSVTVRTNADGIATAPTFTANTQAGTFLVQVVTQGVPTPDLISMTNLPGPAVKLTIVSGAGQRATAGAVYAVPLAVEVTDAFGNAISDGQVAFTIHGDAVTGASADFGSTTTVSVGTDADGLAVAPTLTANDKRGSFRVIALITGTTGEATFDLAVV